MKKILLSALLMSLSLTVMAETQLEKNKRLVTEFYDLAFNKHKPTLAAKTYIGDKYIQHNPNVPNGAEAFYTYFEGHFKKNPESRAIFKRIAADGDLVYLHLHSQLNAKDPGRAIVDIFRIEKDKIVEHWDVVQTVPTENLGNSNTMF